MAHICVMASEKRKIGDICEGLAVRHLVKQGFSILDRNYSKKWGELDVVAKGEDGLHFIEVKGASSPGARPEENVHRWKQKRLYRAIQTWFLDHEGYDDYEWQIDVMAVRLDFPLKKAKIRWLKNVILE